MPVGTVTFSRRSVPQRGCPMWSRSNSSLATLPLHVDSHNTIEDANGLIQVDFANKFLGGGVLGHGCVQEEIRFVICPELMLSMLFTEELGPNEALMIIGSERFSNYTGYGYTFQWAGDFIDNTPRDSSGRRRCAVLAIDAVPFCKRTLEFSKECITRELNKAWIGVSFDTDASSDSLQYPGVATGNWGCGAFGGTPHLKSLLQLMACAEARRPMAYYTFSDDQLRDDIVNIYNILARYNVTVGELYKHLLKFSENKKDVINGRLHAYLEEVLKGNTMGPSNVEDDKMETSVTENLQESVIEIEDTQNSPELFSQGELEQGLVDIAIQAETLNKKFEMITSKQTTLNEGDDKNTEQAFGGKDSTEHCTNKTRQSLFDTIQKLEEEPTASISSPILGNQSKNVTLNDGNLSMECEEKLDPTNELKKKISKKITDYFYKK